MADSELNALARRLSARSGKEPKLKGEKKCNIEVALLCCCCCWGCFFSTIPIELSVGPDELWASRLLGAAIRDMDPNPYYPDPSVCLFVYLYRGWISQPPNPHCEFEFKFEHHSLGGCLPPLVGLGIPLSFLLGNLAIPVDVVTPFSKLLGSLMINSR